MTGAGTENDDCSKWSENVRDLLSRKGEYTIANVAVGVK
jgi:hypothetical protein